MTLFGLRLGFWARSPWAKWPGSWTSKAASPNLLFPGIRQGLFGVALHAAAGFLELTDGGHFENLGLYELARRKVDVIIACDATDDPEFKLQSLANATQRVRADFGFNIRFDQEGFEFGKMMAGTADPEGAEGELIQRFLLARRGFAVATIDYGDKEGRLYYLKTAMIREVPADVYGYKGAHSDFPDQTTVDQFFDEAQLDAYRELGYRLCEGMVEESDVRTQART